MRDHTNQTQLEITESTTQTSARAQRTEREPDRVSYDAELDEPQICRGMD